jgi:branched-subunit amino acid ABC-type transport system permease component
MTEFLRFALLGVGAGGLYALIGQGLVLIYRGSGVLNFAQGTFAAAGAYLFYALSQQAGWPTIPSIALVVVGMTIFGALVHLVVMRKLTGATPFVRLIATLGMFIAVEQGIVLKWGSDPLVLPSFLPSNPVSLGSGIAIGEDRLIVLGLVLAISLALAAWLRFARTGLAISATADDPTAAAALGWSPIRLGALTWGLGTGLAAVGGILLAPISGLDPRTLALVVVPALAGALVGGFRSFSLTLLGGLLVGVAESLTSFYVTAPGWSSSVPFIVIIAALLMRGRALPQRGQLIERLPRVGSGRINLRWAAGVSASRWCSLPYPQSGPMESAPACRLRSFAHRSSSSPGSRGSSHSPSSLSPAWAR